MTDQDVAVSAVLEEDYTEPHPLMKNIYLHTQSDTFELFSELD